MAQDAWPTPFVCLSPEVQPQRATTIQILLLARDDWEEHSVVPERMNLILELDLIHSHAKRLVARVPCGNFQGLNQNGTGIGRIEDGIDP